MMKKWLCIFLFAPIVAYGAAGRLDKIPPTDEKDAVYSLQRGAQVFVNYCLNCHGAAYMRYNRLADLGLTESQIKDNLIFPIERFEGKEPITKKVGDTMTVAMKPKDAKEWFGATPPDLSVIARSRGGDWLYTYLRSFYRSEGRPTGWDNQVFDQVGMPHVLYELQGIQVLKLEQTTDSEGRKHVGGRLVLEKPGTKTKTEYDTLVRDLVNFLVYMGEPVKATRTRLGIMVLFVLGVLLVLAYLLKREFWKDVH